MDARDAYEVALVDIAEAFADLLEAETGQGIDDWTQAQVERIAGALERIEHPKAAAKLRANWELHQRSKIAK
jgi:hypothetical protein